MSEPVGSIPGVVVITGGGGGVGVAAALRFGLGHRIVLGEADAERLGHALAKLSDSGIEATGILCDVTNEEAIGELVAEARSHGDLAVLFHTAGLSPSMASAKRIIEVNYVGSAIVVDAFFPLLQSGSVAVCLGSMAAYRRGAMEFDDLLGDPREPGVVDALVGAARDQSRPAYALSKRGVLRICEEHAASWARKKARIVSVSPGVIDTEMGRLEVNAGARGNPAAALKVTALDRLATADEVAGAAELLCRPAASYVTGCDLLVDGGTIAGYRHQASEEARAGWDDPWE